MILPIYASLERLDARLIEAAKDLYASARAGLPAGDAAALGAGDRRRHAAHLHPGRRRLRQRPVPRRRQQPDDRQRDPVALPEAGATIPSAAALSFVLMALIMVVVVIYIRFAGSEALMGEEAART